MSPTRKIELKHGKGNSSLTVVPFGASVISWIVDGQEKIFVSKKAVMDGTKAIRGGIPICFPNFGPWSEGNYFFLSFILIPIPSLVPKYLTKLYKVRTKT